jgi:formylglycine-generating enzyme required for sulfatase activity
LYLEIQCLEMPLVVESIASPKEPIAPPKRSTIPKPSTTPQAGHTRELDLGKGVTLTFVYIPAGEFWMGSKDDDPTAYDYEKPRHRVRISGFWMGQTPVTQAQYLAVMESFPKKMKTVTETVVEREGILGLGRSERQVEKYVETVVEPSFRGDDRPIEQVSWHDAKQFCQRLSHTSNQTLDLPTESQWEYACRAGSETVYYFGDDPKQLGKYAWYGGNSDSQTYPVKQKQPNGWGLYDMHGNVWEWCLEHWHRNYEGAPTDGVAWLTKNEHTGRVVRGGSGFDSPRSCRSAFRYYDIHGNRNAYIGFRIVCDLRRL